MNIYSYNVNNEKKYIKFFLLIFLLQFIISCDTCDCIDNNSHTISYNNIYLTAKSLNNNSWFCLLFSDGEITRLANNSQLFSTLSDNGKLALLLYEYDKNTKKIILRDLNGDTSGIEVCNSNILDYQYPVLSNNGEHILYNINNELYLWNYNNQSGSAYLELLTSNFCFNNTIPSFSYNGQYIAFIEKLNSSTTLTIVKTKEPEYTLLKKEIYIEQNKFTEIKWMPNKNAFYFILNDTTAYYYDIENGEQIITFGNKTNLGVTNLDISADGKYIVFLNLKNELWLKNTTTNGFFKLLSKINNNDFSNPKFNYDNSKLMLFCHTKLVNSDIKNKTGDLYLLELNFQNNIPKVTNSILLFNNVSTAYWGRYTTL